MQNLSVDILVKKPKIIEGTLMAFGRIIINDREDPHFKERFDMPLSYWNIQDYQQQWQEGLDRIMYEDTSCLVTKLYNPNTTAFAEIWALYKEDTTLYIQNHLLFTKWFWLKLQKMSFTKETCYSFVKPRQTMTREGIKVSEWCTEISYA